MAKSVFDVAVIGGGAAGCACAIMLSRRGKRVVVLESGARVAAKLAATGNGRCNYDNLASGEAERYFTASPAALRALLEDCQERRRKRYLSALRGGGKEFLRL